MISVTDESSISSAITAVEEGISNKGYAIVHAGSSEADILIALARNLGVIQGHVRADASGVVGGNKPISQEWELARSEYRGIGQDEFGPHTDGTFLNGLYIREGEMRKLGPPALILLQCVVPANQGGESILIDGESLLSGFACENPTGLSVLMGKGCVSFCRDDQLALDQSVFARVSHDRLQLRYRCDGATYVSPWALDSFVAFQKLCDSAAFRQEIRLEAGDVLVIDNFRMLHGRQKSFGQESSRKLRRVWVQSEPGEVIWRLEGRPHEHRALQKYLPYTAVSNTWRKGPFLKCGIHDAHWSNTHP